MGRPRTVQLRVLWAYDHDASTSHIVAEIKEHQLNNLHYLSKEDGNFTDVLEQTLASRKNYRVTKCIWSVQNQAGKSNLAQFMYTIN